LPLVTPPFLIVADSSGTGRNPVGFPRSTSPEVVDLELSRQRILSDREAGDASSISGRSGMQTD